MLYAAAADIRKWQPEIETHQRNSHGSVATCRNRRQWVMAREKKKAMKVKMYRRRAGMMSAWRILIRRLRHN